MENKEKEISDKENHCEKCWHINLAHTTSQDYCADQECECHNKPTTKTMENKNLEEEFDKEFPQLLYGGIDIEEHGRSNPQNKNIKSFIRQLLSQEKQKTKDEIIEKMENMEKFIKKRYGIVEVEGQEFEIGYNQALSDSISSIKSNQ